MELFYTFTIKHNMLPANLLFFIMHTPHCITSILSIAEMAVEPSINLLRVQDGDMVARKQSVPYGPSPRNNSSSPCGIVKHPQARQDVSF